MKKKKKKEKKRTLFGENSTLLFLTLEFNGRLNREKERKRRNKRKKEIVHGIRFTIFFFRSRVYTYTRKYTSRRKRVSFRVEVWNFRLKKRITRGRIGFFFFFFFCSSRESERSFESTLISRNRSNNEAKRSHEGHYAEGKAKERGRISIRESERRNESSSSLCRNCTERGGMLGGTRTRVNKEVHAYTYSAHGK